MPSDPATFWDKIARQYAAQPIADQASYAATLERIRSFLRKDSHVLELGGGTGQTALKLAQYVGRYRCTDASPEMIKIATENASQSCAKNVTFGVAEITDHDLPHDLDVVLALNLLHLVPDIMPALENVCACMRPGGFFISKSATFSGPGKLMWLPIRIMQGLGKAPYVNLFSSNELERMLRSTGFDIVSCDMLPSGSRNCMIVAKKR